MLCGHEWMRNRNENTEVKPKNTTFIAARFGSTLSSEGTQFWFAAKRDIVVELVAAPTKRRFANRAIINVDDLHSLVQFSSLSTVVPNRLIATPMWVAEKWQWGREQQPKKCAESSNFQNCTYQHCVLYQQNQNTDRFLWRSRCLRCSSYQVSNIVSIDFIVEMRHQ